MTRKTTRPYLTLVPPCDGPSAAVPTGMTMELQQGELDERALSSLELMELAEDTLFGPRLHAMDVVPPRSFRGMIDATLVEVIHFHERSQRTGSLRIASSQGIGVLWFKSGALVHAEQDLLVGMSAALEVLSWREGEFQFVSGEPPALTMRTPLESLLTEASQRAKTEDLSNVPAHVLATLRQIDGFIAAALVDSDAGQLRAALCDSLQLDIEVAAKGTVDVVRTKQQLLRRLGINEEVEEFVVKVGSQSHLIRPIKGQQELFLYLTLESSHNNLAYARLAIEALAPALAQIKTRDMSW